MESEKEQVNKDPIDKLVRIGFSEHEARAYIALLRENPVTGYQIAKLSGVPRSMIYKALRKLVARGAAMTLRKKGSIQYIPVQAEELLDQVSHTYKELVTSLKDDLTVLDSAPDLGYVWSIQGHKNIMTKAQKMIDQAESRIYLSLLPATFPALKPALERAIGRKVRVVAYSTEDLDLWGGRVVATPTPEQARERAEGLWLVLTIDGEEALIGELLAGKRARASWTGSPLFVFVVEHYLGTDLYLPHVLALLGDQAQDLVQEKDHELFACIFKDRRVPTGSAPPRALACR